MGIALLVTSSLMTNIYIKYCESDLNYYEKCGDDEAHFLVLPVFGFFTMAAWVRYSMKLSLHLIFNHMHNAQIKHAYTSYIHNYVPGYNKFTFFTINKINPNK